MPNWLKTVLKVVVILIVVIAVLLLGTLLYINSNKSKLQALVTTELNKNLNGSIIIGNMNPVFFKGFPDISLSLHHVLLRDKRFNEHHHTLLDAQDFEVSVNTAALLKGTISINHIDISNAAIDLYTDSNGYSNTAVFKKSDKKKTSGNDNSSSAAEISKFNLQNVSFAVNNQQANKLFHFDVSSLTGKLAYPDSGWHANVHLNVDAKSMAFNTDNGSFIKGKQVEGDLAAGYNEGSGQINVQSGRFDIGGNIFKLNALFAVGKKPASFTIKLAADAITWQGASSLLAANISKKLAMFNMDKPIAVKATIAGSFSGGGDPFLHVEAKARDTKLTTPGGNIDACSFDGLYTNNYSNGKGFSDANSIIKIFHLSGSYSHIPFKIDTGSIINLEKPIATGNFTSSFPLSNLNYLMGKVAKFTNGTADMKLRYKADIVDYRLNKPIIAGVINLRNADINYVPRNLNLKNTSLSLQFNQDALVLNNIRLQSGKSVVLMEGRVNNFLNLYYDSPEKIVLTWQIHSPQLYLGEFLGFLNNRQQPPAKKSRNSGNIIDQLSNVLDKAHAQMHMQVANLHYKNFLATDAKADVLLSEDGVLINNMSVKHAGGSLKFNGQIIQRTQGNNKFIFSTVVSNVNIHEFFYAFDNFGLTDITYNNLKGTLSAKAQVSGLLTNAGAVAPRSINGYAAINLKNGALVNYNPLKTVGKFAFPFRNLNNIEIPVLDAKFDLQGDKIIINPMKLTSSVINADIAGTYGLTNGTNITLDIPLRNPKGDSTITDKQELLKKRYKGIVLHILAKDDEKGKLKIGWNKDHAKTP
jgi:hypothetical protein